MEILVAVVSGLIAALVLWKLSDIKRPPGPWGLPVVGYLPFLTSKPYLTFTRLAKRYGNVFSIRLGSRYMVVLNDFQSTKDAFMQDAFIGRPDDFAFAQNKETAETGAFCGPAWKEQRRFCLHMLRDLGLGKSKMESLIQEEISELLEHFEKNIDKPFCIRELLAHSMSNNIAALMFGKRFQYGDPVLQMLMRMIYLGSKVSKQVGWILFFPWIRKVFQFLNIGSVDLLIKVNVELRNYAKKEFIEHEATFNPDNIRDFMDGYILEMQKRKDDPSFCKPVLEDLVAAFFGAGTETVRTSVEWLVLTAASYPKAQNRIQAEIREVVGYNRLPVWSDHKNMPYTDAFIMEVMRWRTLTPLNLLRYTLTDAELNGYFIPKHTQVLSNNWAIHHDPEYWGSDADEFVPERFLYDHEKEVKKWEHHIPFSIGKRACPGEPMAKVEIFLYFVSILQRFDVKLPEGKVADFEGELGIGFQMKQQDIVLTKRVN